MHPFRTLLLAACCTLLLALAAPAQADTTTYYKYRPQDLNALPTFSQELPSLAANNDTGYIVEKNDEGLLLAYTTVAGGRYRNRHEFTHSLTGKIVGERTYTFTPGSKEKQFTKETKYQWDGDLVSKQSSRDSSGATENYLILKQGNKLVWTEYVNGEPTGTTYEVPLTASGLIEQCVWQPTSTKRYVQTYDPATGLQKDSMGYTNGAYSFKQVFLYADDGRQTGLDAYDQQGKKYSSSTYDAVGNRIEESYFGAKYVKRYVHTYDEAGLNTKVQLFHDDKPVYTCSYVRHPGGSMERTDVYAPNGELVATYPNNRVKYLRSDGTARSGHKGTVLKKVTLY